MDGPEEMPVTKGLKGVYIFLAELHLFEEMKVVTADREDFGSLLELQHSAARERATDFVYPGDIDDHSPVDLPESDGVEFLGQLSNALLDKGFPFFCYDQSVFVFGLEVVYLLHRNEADAVFMLRLDPTQEVRSPSPWQLRKDLLHDLG